MTTTEMLAAELVQGQRYTVTAYRAINRPASSFVGVYVKPKRGGTQQVLRADATGMEIEIATSVIVSAEASKSTEGPQ